MRGLSLPVGMAHGSLPGLISIQQPRQTTILCARKPRKESTPQAPDNQPGPTGNPLDMPILEIPSSSTPSRQLERSSYRRKGLADDDLKQAKAEARRELKAREEAVQRASEALKSGQMDLMFKSLRPSVMLVDGYNILHRSEHLTHLFAKNSDYARGELEKWCSMYCRAARIQCLLVFDAMLSRNVDVRPERSSPWLSVVYSTQSEADTYIVARAKQFQERGAYKVVVVSGDRRIQEELADDVQSIIMLDADTFARHLRECNVGNTSGPEQWRSVWQLPRWSATPSASTQQGVSNWPTFKGSAGRGDVGVMSEDEEASESGRNVQEVMDSDELQAQLNQLLMSVRQEQLRQRSKELAQDLSLNQYAVSSLVNGIGTGQAEIGREEGGSTGSGSAAGGAAGDSDDDDDDLDLDALLKKKL